MKRVLIALVLAVMASASLLAREVAYRACTKDHKIVELAIVVADNVPTDVDVSVGLAFMNTAKALTAEALVGKEGFVTFVAALTEEERAAIAIGGPPVVQAGSCE